MAIDVVMPRLGWTMEEGTLVEWLKSPGDAVAAGDLLFTVESDKALNEIESMDAGTLHIPSNAPTTGDVIPVGAVIGYLLADGEQGPTEVPTPTAVAGASGSTECPSSWDRPAIRRWSARIHRIDHRRADNHESHPPSHR